MDATTEAANVAARMTKVSGRDMGSVGLGVSHDPIVASIRFAFDAQTDVAMLVK